MNVIFVVKKTFRINEAANKLSVKAKNTTYKVDALKLKKKSISGNKIYKIYR